MENTKKLSLYALLFALATLGSYNATQCWKQLPREEWETEEMVTSLPVREGSEMGSGEEMHFGILPVGDVESEVRLNEPGEEMGMGGGMGAAVVGSRKEQLRNVNLGQ